MVVAFGLLQNISSSLPQLSTLSSSSSSCSSKEEISTITRRRSIILWPSISVAVASSFSSLPTPFRSASALQPQFQDELQEEEDRLVSIFQEASPSVVFIKDLEIAKSPQNANDAILAEDENVRVEGTGSGFIWDKFGHIVTNYHVVAKLATDTSGLQRCKVYLVDTAGNSFVQEGKIVGFDPSYDLAVLKVDIDGHQIKPVKVGTSGDLRVGQSCFSIGNPFGYENTLTTGVVSGLGREIPSPDGRAIRGAIQTDAAINSGKMWLQLQLMNKQMIMVFLTGNSGGPLIDSYGHVIGVNTATFTRKGTGVSSGVNFAIPIDTVMRSVPYLIVYGTPYSNRF